MCVYIYIYIHILHRERERERERCYSVVKATSNICSNVLFKRFQAPAPMVRKAFN